jgi:hypothetical protein
MRVGGGDAFIDMGNMSNTCIRLMNKLADIVASIDLCCDFYDVKRFIVSEKSFILVSAV